jgi:hypothetical protein
MNNSIIKNNILFVLLIFFSLCLFIPNGFIFASKDPSSITINTQPASTGSVDFVLSSPPVLLVRDSDNNPVSGVAVTAFKASGKGDLKGNLTAITDSNGLANFQGLKYTKTDLFAISFIYTGGSPITSDFIQLSPGLASSSNSSISVSPDDVTADGKSLATIKIQCEDQYGNMIPGANVKVSVSGNSNTLSQPNSVDSPGIVTVNLSSNVAESKVISVTINGVSLGNSNPIIFNPGIVAKLLLSADTPITTNQTSQITVTGLDNSGNIVSNDSLTKVVLSADNGGSLSSALIAFSDGVASATLSKNTIGKVNLTASVGDIDAQTQIVFIPSDSTVPNILSQYPLTGAQSVPINVIPYINFSKTMDITSLTTDNIELRKITDNSIMPTEVLVANGGKRVILQPDSNLNTNTKYYLYVSTDVKDLAGNNLASTYTDNQFTTTSDTHLSSSNQEQNIIKDIKAVSGTIKTDDGSNNTDTSVVKNSAQQTNNVSGDNSIGATSDGSAVNNSSINVTAGSSEPQAQKSNDNNVALYAEAGFLDIFKNFNINDFGNWFVSNFIWVIISLAVVFVIYLFWFFYIK